MLFGCPLARTLRFSSLTGSLALSFTLLATLLAAHPPARASVASVVEWEPCTSSTAVSEPSTRFHCAEQELWHALGDGDAKPRRRADALLSAALAHSERDGALSAKQRSQLHFYRGALRLARALENGNWALAALSPLSINPDFEASVELDPENHHFVSFLDSMHVAVPALLGNWDAATRAAEKGFANVAKNPMLNTLSLSGTTIGLPLSTGVPAKTLALLKAWRCEGADFCTRNTQKAPFARPGLAYHFGEAHARMGETEEATRHFEAALAAPGADTWPYAARVREHLADMPRYVKTFQDLGAHGSAVWLVYANQKYGCVFCHGRAP